jgi:hemolysin activation/secretion protein
MPLRQSARRWSLRSLIVLSALLYSMSAFAQENDSGQSLVSRLHGSLTLDNSGATETGRLRSNALAWLDAPFRTDDRVHFGYYTAPTRPLDVNVIYAGYRMPWAGGRNTAELSGYISNQNFTTRSLTSQDPFSGTYNGYSIQGKVAPRIATQNLKFGVLSHTVETSLDFQHLSNVFDDSDNESTTRVWALPGSLAYEIALDGRDQAGHGISSFLLARYVTNLDIGNISDAEAFSRNRNGAKTNFDFFRFAGEVKYTFWNDWMIFAEFFAQYSDEPLIGSQTFILGGPGSVRALHQDEAFGDSGVLGRIEVFTPAIFEHSIYKTFGLTFIDAATVWRESASQMNAGPSDSAIGIGIGLRWAGLEHASADFDIAYLAGGSIHNSQDRRSDDKVQFLFSVSLSF